MLKWLRNAYGGVTRTANERPVLFVNWIMNLQFSLLYGVTEAASCTCEGGMFELSLIRWNACGISAARLSGNRQPRRFVKPSHVSLLILPLSNA